MKNKILSQKEIKNQLINIISDERFYITGFESKMEPIEIRNGGVLIGFNSYLPVTITIFGGAQESDFSTTFSKKGVK